MREEKIIILDFGGQYKQLIARRVRECGVYCEIHSHTLTAEKVRGMKPAGIIFTGGPNSVFAKDAPSCGRDLFELGVPVLGICYGSQLMAHVLGGEVKTAPTSEYGQAVVTVDEEASPLLKDVRKESTVWMSHTDYIARVPEGFKVTSHTAKCPVASMEDAVRRLYAVQFHPEVLHTEEGTKILYNWSIMQGDLDGESPDTETPVYTVSYVGFDGEGSVESVNGESGGIWLDGTNLYVNRVAETPELIQNAVSRIDETAAQTAQDLSDAKVVLNNSIALKLDASKIAYGDTAPASPVKGMIWLKPKT